MIDFIRDVWEPHKTSRATYTNERAEDAAFI